MRQCQRLVQRCQPKCDGVLTGCLTTLTHELMEQLDHLERLDRNTTMASGSADCRTATSAPDAVSPTVLCVQYDKRSGTGAMSGQLYEVKMCCLMFLRGIRHGKFHLAANLDGAGAFDDFVLQLHSEDGGATHTKLVQLKHKENAGISRAKLLSCSPKSKFGLIKYFLSYRDLILPGFQERRGHQVFGTCLEHLTLVLYTNADIAGLPEVPDHQSDLLSTGERGGVFSFQEDRDSDVWSLARDISEYDSFLRKLRVYTRQATEAQLGALIKDELCDTLRISWEHCELIFSKLLDRIQEWWAADEGCYLTETSPLWNEVVVNVSQVINEPIYREIHTLRIRFNDRSMEPLTAKLGNAKALQVQAETTRLSLCKVVQALEQGCRRFVLGHSHAALRFWQSPWCPLLVMECIEPSAELLSTLESVLGLHPDKALVVVVPERERQALRDISAFHDENNFTSLDGISQHRVLCTKIDFQGHRVALGDLIRTEHIGDSSEVDLLLEQIKHISTVIKSLGNKFVFSTNFNVEWILDCLTNVQLNRNLFKCEQDKQGAIDTNVLLGVCKTEEVLCVQLESLHRELRNADQTSEGETLLKHLQNVKELLGALQDPKVNASAIIKMLNGVVRRRDLFHSEERSSPLMNADFFLKLHTDEVKLAATLQDLASYKPTLKTTFDDRSLLMSLRAVGMMVSSAEENIHPDVGPLIGLLDREWDVNYDLLQDLTAMLEHLVLNIMDTFRADTLLKVLKYVSRFLRTIRYHPHINIGSVLKSIEDTVRWRLHNQVNDDNALNLQTIQMYLRDELRSLVHYQEELQEALEEPIMYLDKDITFLAIVYHQKQFKLALTLMRQDLEALKIVYRHRTLKEAINDSRRLLEGDAKCLHNVYEHEHLKESITILVMQLERDVAWLLVLLRQQKLMETLTGNALYDLLKESHMRLGAPLEERVSYYIPRTLQREGTVRPDSVCDVPDRATVIVAEPGMGKSTLMAHVALQTKAQQPTTWVMRINLNNMTSYLKDLRLEDEALEFLSAAAKGMGPFEAKLLEHCVNITGRVVVLLDGFDEVCPHYKHQMIGVIQELLATQVKKLCISSRQHLRDDLETCSNSRAYSIQPFSEDDQRSFLQKMWSKSVDGTRLDTYIGDVLRLVSQSLSDTERSFMGIPLQTMLVAEVFESDLKDGLRPRQLDATELYEQFFRKKCVIYFEQKEGVDMSKPGVINDYDNKIREIEEHHELAAVMSYLSPEDQCKLDDQSIQERGKQFLAEYERKWAMVGIVTSTLEGKPQFLHRTMAEFLVGKWFSKHFQRYRTFIKHTLYTSDYSVVKLIFDRVLACGLKLHSAVLNGNLEAFCELLQRSNVNARDRGGRTALHIAATSKLSEDLVRMTHLLTQHGCDATAVDEVLQLSAMQQADLTSNWGVLDVMLQRTRPVPKIDILKQDKASILDTACRNGYVDILRYLVRKGAGLNTRLDEEDSRPLHVAVRHKQTEVTKYLLHKSKSDMGSAKYLLRHRVQINVKDREGNAALHYAAEIGHLATVRLLVEAGCSVNACNKRKETALGLAAEKTHFDIVQFLVKAGSKAAVRDKYNMTPLHHAVRKGSRKVVQLLIEKGCDVDACNDYLMTPLHYCALDGHVDMVRCLINAGCCVDKCNMSNFTALHVAASRGHAPVVEALIEAGSTVNALGKGDMAPLHHAVEKSHVEVVKLLIRAGCDVDACNAEKQTPLHYAVDVNCADIVKDLVMAGCNVNALDHQNKTPLFYATQHGHNLIRLFLLSVNATDEDDGGATATVQMDRVTRENTVVHRAVQEGDLSLVQDAIDLGQSVDEQDNSKRTPLHYASRLGRVDVAKLLISLGCTLDVFDLYKETPLHYSSEEGHLDIVQLLVDLGSDLNARNIYGMTPLHYAAMYGHLEIFFLLVESGSELSVRDIADLTPLERAVSRGHLHIARSVLDRRRETTEIPEVSE